MRTVLGTLAAVLVWAATANAGQDIDPRVTAGMRRYAEGERKAALEQFADLLDDAAAPAQSVLASALYLVHDCAENEAGEPMARRAVELFPELRAPVLALGASLIAQGRFRQAESAYRAAMERIPDDDRLMFSTGMACALARRHLEAAKMYDQALERSAEDPLYHFCAGENHVKIHNLDRAEFHFRRCLLLEPTNSSAHWQLARLLSWKDKVQLADQHFRKAINCASDTTAGIEAGIPYANFLLDQRRAEEAVEIARGIVEQRPEHLRAWSLLARCYARLGQKGKRAQARRRYLELQERADQAEDASLLELLRAHQRAMREARSSTPPAADESAGGADGFRRGGRRPGRWSRGGTTMMGTGIAAGLIAAVAGGQGTQQLEPRAVVIAELTAEARGEAPVDPAGREARLRELLREAGAGDADVEAQDLGFDRDAWLRQYRLRLFRLGVQREVLDGIVELEAERVVAPGPNLTVRVAGSTDRILVFETSLDVLPESPGVIANWSGCVVLANLYEAFRDSQPRHTLVFSFVAGQNVGLLGSQQLAASFADEQVGKITAAVNFESLGAGAPSVWLDVSEAGPLYVLKQAADNIGLEVPVLTFKNLPDSASDLTAFRRRRVPTLYLHGVEPASAFESLRGGKDLLDADQLDAAYRVLVELVRELDRYEQPLTTTYLYDELGVGPEQLAELQKATAVQLGGPGERGDPAADPASSEAGQAPEDGGR